MVSTTQSLFGIQTDGAAWRSLYVLGVLPLALIIVLRLGMRETRRFEAVKAAEALRPKRTWGDLFAEACTPVEARVPAPHGDRRAALELRLPRHRRVDGVLDDLRAAAR